MADTSVVFNVLARDRASRVLARIRRNALHSSSAIAASLGPSLIPVLGATTAGIVGVGAALGAAGVAAGVFGAVTASAFSEVKKAADKTDDLREKIRLLGRQAELAPDELKPGYILKQKKAMIELEARLSLIDPATRKVVVQYGNLKNAWLDFVDVNKPAVFASMSGGFSLLTGVIPKLQPLFDVANNAVRRLLGSLQQAAGGGLERSVAWLANQAGPALQSLGAIIGNLWGTTRGFLSTFVTDGQGFLDWLERTTAKWKEWANADTGGIQDFANYVRDNGPRVFELLTDIGSALKNIAKAVAPLAPVSLAIASALAAILAALPPETVTALTVAWIGYSFAVKGYHAYVILAGFATKAWAAAQRRMNLALWASPITWIVLGVLLLVGAIVLIATKTTWFQTIWKTVWGGIKDAAQAVGSWFAGPFAGFFVGLWNGIVAGVVGAKNWIVNTFNTVVGFVASIPGRIASAAWGMWDGIKNAFRSAINWIIGKWNGLEFAVPSFSAFGQSFGGFTIGVPDIPFLDTGGTITRSGLAVVHKGEQVTPAHAAPLSGGRGGPVVIELRGADDEFKRFFRAILRKNRDLLVI